MTDRTYCTRPHLYGPADPTAWVTWADALAATHDQHDCPDCRLPVLWTPRDTPEHELPADALFDLEDHPR